MNEKLKSFLLNDQLFYGIIVILVALASFGLGRASVAEVGENVPQNELSFESEPRGSRPVVEATSAVEVAKPAASGALVVSKSGTKYHLLTCPGAKTIKEENKIFFASVVEAEAAGYKPAANCPELQ